VDLIEVAQNRLGAVSFEEGNKLSGSIRGEFLNKLNN